MREFVASLLIVALLLGSWLLFDGYSQRELTGFAQTIEEDILPAVRSGEPEKAEEYLAELSADWEEYKKAALIFLGTAAINEVDYALAKSRQYAAAGDAAGTAGELASLAGRLTALHAREDLNIANVF